MNPDPDYSAAYAIVRTDDPQAPDGHGFTFTIGRGTEICCAAIRAIEPMLVGRDVDELVSDLGEVSRRVTHDSHLRWLGPEKGVVQMAAGAVINALWDLAGKLAGLPVWRLLATTPPQQLVDLVDWRYLTDALTPDEALTMLKKVDPGRREREAALMDGYPAYTTSPGWLGYSDDKMVALARQAVADGFSQIKLKVGASLTDDVRRMKLAREAVGPEVRIAIDANQRWDVTSAIEWVRALAPFDPYWIEEPTSPDDVLGHAQVRRAVSPIRVATGEHVANRVMFKQLIESGAVDVIQIDACRVAGVNENVAILLLAAARGIPVCPHAGGVGLCELVQHLSMFDYVAVSGTTQDRVIEYVDHLHEHFEAPVVMRNGRYLPPAAAGFSSQVRAESLERFRFPDGIEWR